MINRAALSGILSLTFTTSAFAHGGHVGELAGHAHWVGVAALAGAALVAGLVAMKGKKKENGEETKADGEEKDNAGEAA
jgi:Family of unknown function (DUF6732)